MMGETKDEQNKGYRQSRARTHFKFYSEQYLIGGSTRAELEPDERSVWLDFLCMGSLNFGKVEIFSRDVTARQLLIAHELLDRSIDKFIKFGKVSRKYDKRQKKEIFTIIKWSQYQAQYLTKRLENTGGCERSENGAENDAEKNPKGDEMREDDIKPDEMRENEASKESHSKTLPDSHLKSSSSGEDFNELKKKFLGLLKNCKGYPFNEGTDTLLFELVAVKYPNVDILYQLEKKIEWWKQKASPSAVNSKPRSQLLDHFKKSFEKKGGPEKAGTIAKQIVLTTEMKDKIGWLENEIRRSEAKRD